MQKVVVKRFTFLEILVAVVILGISLAMVMSIIGAARSRVIRAERRWGRQHLLDQATEYYLLAGPDAALPEVLLPRNYTASCTLEPVQNLPEHALEPLNGYVLARYTITVYGLRSEVIAEREVAKPVPEEELF